MDTCIVIRTIVYHDGIAIIQAGAGIVADSDPQHEYQETLHKAAALFTAIRKRGGDRGEISIMLLVIDNYDSFTYNLVQYLSELYTDGIRVFRNDRITVAEIAALDSGADRYFARPLHPERSGHLGGSHPTARPGNAAFRRLPRPPVHRLCFRRQGDSRTVSHARQSIPDPSQRNRYL